MDGMIMCVCVCVRVFALQHESRDHNLTPLL